MAVQLDLTNPDLFNDLFFKLRDSKKKFILSYGGRGSGKTMASVANEIVNALTSKHRILVVRKYQSSLTGSIVNTFLDVLKSWGLQDQFTYNINAFTITFKNQSTIQFRGCDDAEKLKGYVCTRILIEETNELEQSDFENLVSILRGIHLVNPQITLLFNPVNALHWIKKLFIDSTVYTSQTDIFHTTCHNNKFVEQEYRDNLDRLKFYNYNRWNIEYNGYWGSNDRTGSCYQSFTIDNCVKEVKYDKDRIICLSFDDNRSPYISLLCAHIVKDENNNYIYQIFDEFALFNTNLQGVCEAFTAKYHEHENGVFIYGDSTSKRGSSLLEVNENFYTLAMGYLQGFRPKLKILPSNNSITASLDYMNFIFGSQDKLKIFIDPSLENLIDDLENTKLDPDGKKDKRKIRDKKRGLTYEEHGHLSDALTYLVIQSNLKDFQTFKMGGLTFKPIVKFKDKLITPLKEKQHNGVYKPNAGQKIISERNPVYGKAYDFFYGNPNKRRY